MRAQHTFATHFPAGLQGGDEKNGPADRMGVRSTEPKGVSSPSQNSSTYFDAYNTLTRV